MGRILESNQTEMIFVLAAIGGFANALDRASLKSMGDEAPLVFILIVSLIAGAIGGIFALYVLGAVLQWTGRWIGGKATASQVRAAIAWPHVITAWGLLIWIPELLIFDQELFTTHMPRVESSLLLILLLAAFYSLEMTIFVWFVVVALKCLGEAQGFSAWRAIGNYGLAMMVLLVPILVIIALLA